MSDIKGIENIASDIRTKVFAAVTLLNEVNLGEEQADEQEKINEAIDGLNDII